MMLRKISLMFVAIVAMLFVQSCDDENTTTDNTARVQFRLVDTPGDYVEVNIDIEDVQYNSSEDDLGWRSFESFTPSDEPVDLLDLVDGKYLPLTDDIITLGTLKQIRLVLGDENTVVVKDESDEPSERIYLDTPSAQQSGLKLKLEEPLEEGFSYIFILDFDVDKSVVKAGNSGKYILKPVIRISAEATSGSIGGMVNGEVKDGDPVALGAVMLELFKGVESITTTYTTTANEETGEVDGNFLFQGLEAGVDYTIKIVEQEEFEDYESENVSVNIGEETEVDILLLLVAEVIEP